MITIIFGEPGAGKTSLNTYFLKRLYREQGDRLLSYCREKILEQNRERLNPLTLPKQPPIFADFDVKFLTDYEEEYKPYYINGYYFGIKNDKMPTQYVPPGSKIFLSEAQRYFDSRKSATLPDHVSRAFEMHRHADYDITMDVQRAGLIDLNIRALCKRFIEVLRTEHEKTATGRIIKTTFFCREFPDWLAVDQYLSSGAQTYTETQYENKGNIYRCFDSKNHGADFVPSEGKDYNFLPFVGKGDKIPGALKMFYKTDAPKGYRTGAQEKGAA